MTVSHSLFIAKGVNFMFTVDACWNSFHKFIRVLGHNCFNSSLASISITGENFGDRIH